MENQLPQRQGGTEQDLIRVPLQATTQLAHLQEALNQKTAEVDAMVQEAQASKDSSTSAAHLADEKTAEAVYIVTERKNRDIRRLTDRHDQEKAELEVELGTLRGEKAGLEEEAGVFRKEQAEVQLQLQTAIDKKALDMSALEAKVKGNGIQKYEIELTFVGTFKFILKIVSNRIFDHFQIKLRNGSKLICLFDLQLVVRFILKPLKIYYKSIKLIFY
jgi:hypothetical protein